MRHAATNAETSTQVGCCFPSRQTDQAPCEISYCPRKMCVTDINFSREGASSAGGRRAHRDAQHSIMASGRSGADIAKGTAGSFAPATKDAASELASKTVGLVKPAA